LVFPGAAVDGAGFDLEEIDAVAGEGLKSGEERAGTMSEEHGERNLAGIGGEPGRGFLLRKQKNEAGEILGVVLDGFGQNRATIVLGGAASANRGAGFVPAGTDLADTAGSVFGGNAVPVRMGAATAFASREGRGRRRRGAKIGTQRA